MMTERPGRSCDRAGGLNKIANLVNIMHLTKFLQNPKNGIRLWAGDALIMGITLLFLIFSWNYAAPAGKGLAAAYWIQAIILASLTFFCIYCWHFSYWRLIRTWPCRLVLVGRDPVINDLKALLGKRYSPYYQLVGLVDNLGHMSIPPRHLAAVVDNPKDVDLVVFSTSIFWGLRLKNNLLGLPAPPRILDAENFYQLGTGTIPLTILHRYVPKLTGLNAGSFKPEELIRRIFDIAFVLISLPLCLPVIFIVALAIKLDDGGPVFFVQERLGKEEAPFRLVKFRTMVEDAEAQTGPRWAQADDPRITRVGKVLRKLRLDELPQFYNVLKGEMSVIGARPIRRHFADLMAREIPHYRTRFLVKPGLTGWAQVNHDYAGSKEGQKEKFQYEMFYLSHRSAWLDLLILFKTIKIMTMGKGT